VEGGLRTAENDPKTYDKGDKGNNREQSGKFPEACVRRQAAYFSDFTSHESFPEARFGWYFPYYGSQKSRGVLFPEKKGPCQECPGCRRNWRLDLGGISPIMGPRNPGGCYFLKKKAPARNAPVVVGIGFHRKSKIQRILTKRIPFSEKVREAK
jgi:hypothetical protein